MVFEEVIFIAETIRILKNKANVVWIFTGDVMTNCMVLGWNGVR